MKKWILLLCLLIALIGCEEIPVGNDGNFSTPIIITNTLSGADIIIDSAGTYRCVEGDKIVGAVKDGIAGFATAGECNLSITFTAFGNGDIKTNIVGDGTPITFYVNGIKTDYVYVFDYNSSVVDISGDTLSLLLFRDEVKMK